MYYYPNYVQQSIAEHPLVVSTGMVGLEIELEDVRDRHIDSRYWISEPDGSLRNNGMEFIFRGPIGGVDLFAAVTEAGKHFHTHKPDMSWRCSTHLHLDVRGMTVKEFRNLLIIHTVYEIPMFKCAGMNRYKNNFCPAYGFAQGQLQTLSRFWHLDDSRFMGRVVNSWSKYSALNLLPVADKGSVELRIANAMTTPGSLLRHCNRALTLKKMAMEWEGSCEDLLTHLIETDVNKVFHKKLTGPLTDPITQDDVLTGAILANDILCLHKTQGVGSEINEGIILPTLLDENKIATLLEIADERAHTSSEWENMYAFLDETMDTGDWEEMSVSRLRDICSMFGVSPGYVVNIEHRSQLLNR